MCIYFVRYITKIPCDVIQYETERFFRDKKGMEWWIENVFNPVLFHDGEQYIIKKGKAYWTEQGVLVCND